MYDFCFKSGGSHILAQKIQGQVPVLTPRDMCRINDPHDMIETVFIQC